MHPREPEPLTLKMDVAFSFETMEHSPAARRETQRAIEWPATAMKTWKPSYIITASAGANVHLKSRNSKQLI